MKGYDDEVVPEAVELLTVVPCQLHLQHTCEECYEIRRTKVARVDGLILYSRLFSIILP